MENRVLWIAPGRPSAVSQALAGTVPVEFCEPDAAPARIRAFSCPVVVLDASISALDALLQVVRSLPATVPIALYRPGIPIADAVRLARLGIQYFFDSDAAVVPHLQELILAAGRAGMANLAAAVQPAGWENLLVGTSRAMERVIETIRLVGPRRATVLVTGETGTGKEIAAKALHQAGPRRRGPFVAFNCTAVPETLLESELFGHVRGAFTGALQSRAGRFEQAQGGTLFLDEVGEMPLDLQAKLLRVLQERELQRLGSSETVRLDVRVIAATNADLTGKIETGRFREDLYYRLNVVPLAMPPLRERLEDVPVLASHFIEKVCRAESVPTRELLPEAVERLSRYGWPGNVRQLENAIEMAVSLSGDRTLLTAVDFPLPAVPRLSSAPAVAAMIDLPDSGLDFEETVQGIERSILEQALRRTNGNKKAAAEMLGLKRTTLAAKIRGFATSACN